LHCYTIDAAFITPILLITSPVKRCGKTTLLELLGALVPKLLLASSITPAALFRSIEKYSPTLLVDEADTFLANNDELRGVINAGHTRGTAKVIRSAGDKHEPRVFSTWCPKAIALIGRLRDTLEDRSIIIEMRRRAPNEKVERLRRDRIHQELNPIRRRAARWATDYLEQIREADPDVPDSLHDRAQDNWRSLFAIADVAGGEWPDRARQVAVALSGPADENDNAPRVQLLLDLRQLFEKRQVDRLPSEDVVAALVKMEDRPWPEWKQGKPLSKRQLASLLKPFRVRPKVLRTNGGTFRGYELNDFQDAFARYLPEQEKPSEDADQDPEPPYAADPPAQSVTTVTSPEYQRISGVRDPKQTPLCYGSENPKKACDSANVTDVTDRQGGTGEEGAPEEEFEV
jgi:putative DNA primase/helicase